MRVFAEAADPQDRVEIELIRLAGLDLPHLRHRWRRVFGRAAPALLSRAMLIGTLSYRLQADAFGHLDRVTAGRIDQLARGGAEIAAPAFRSIKPGTLLVREWEGRLQRVTVLNEGFAWNGTTYASLSHVARAITGTNWNGPRFFGLRDRKGEARTERTEPQPAKSAAGGNQSVDLRDRAGARFSRRKPSAHKTLTGGAA